MADGCLAGVQRLIPSMMPSALRKPRLVPLWLWLAAASTTAAFTPPMCSPAGWREGVAYSRRSSSYRNSTVRSVADCCEDCNKDEQCLAWNYKLPSTNCFLWHTVPALAPGTPTQHSTIGTKFPPAPPPSPAPPPPPAPKGALNVL